MAVFVIGWLALGGCVLVVGVDVVWQVRLHRARRTMIVKCQRSIAGNRPTPSMLFYTEDKSWMWEGELSEDWRAHFGPTTSPDDSKFYAEVLWPDKHKPPTFRRRVGNMEW